MITITEKLKASYDIVITAPVSWPRNNDLLLKKEDEEVQNDIMKKKKMTTKVIKKVSKKMALMLNTGRTMVR
jgi:predicted phosphoribosyltransferase